MEYATEAQKACYEKVTAWMKELFGGLAVALPDAPIIQVTVGSAVAQTEVYALGDDDAAIRTAADVVTGAELTADLMEYLMRENANLRFGAFGIDRDNDIVFVHSILGATCDKAELRSSVTTVAITADVYDDRIVSRWGGRRALDHAPAPASP
jgi:hypothetical protein